MSDPDLVGIVRDVRGDTVTAALTVEAVPGLTFSRGHAYSVGQVGTFVRIPMGLVDLFAIVVQVGSAPREMTDTGRSAVDWAAPGEAWMRLELMAEGGRGVRVSRGVSRYPAIGDPVHLITADDLSRLYRSVGPEYVRIGSIANAPELGSFVNLNTLVSRHTAVVGNTGSGKSSTVSALLCKLADIARFPSARVVLIDVHGEYESGLSHISSVKQVVIDHEECAKKAPGGTSKSDATADQGRLYLPYWALTYDEFVEIAFGSLDDPSHASVKAWILDRKTDFARRNPGMISESTAITVDTPIPFDIRRLWFEYHELVYATHTAQQNAQSATTRAYAVDSAGVSLRGDINTVAPPTYLPLSAGKVFLGMSGISMRRQVDHLGGLLRDRRYEFLFKPGPWMPDDSGDPEADLDLFLKEWLGGNLPITIADLSNVPSAILKSIVGVLLRILYDALVWSRLMPEGGRFRPLLLVLEEAHRYLGADGGPASVIVERLVKEGRKHGVGLLLVSQRPSEIQSTVLSQVGSFVILRLTNHADRSIVSSAAPDHLSSLFDSVSVLRTGEALLIGEMVEFPSRVVIDAPLAVRPNSSDPLVVSGDRSSGWDSPHTDSDYSDVTAAWRRAGTQRRERG